MKIKQASLEFYRQIRFRSLRLLSNGACFVFKVSYCLFSFKGVANSYSLPVSQDPMNVICEIQSLHLSPCNNQANKGTNSCSAEAQLETQIKQRSQMGTIQTKYRRAVNLIANLQNRFMP